VTSYIMQLKAKYRGNDAVIRLESREVSKI